MTHCVWRRGGNLFDFLCLWYGVSARQMWRCILAGEVILRRGTGKPLLSLGSHGRDSVTV